MTADERDEPAAALGIVWEALDSLPRSVPSPDATATTIEMVAISAQHRSIVAAQPAPLAWVAAVAIVTAGFLGGMVAGRVTAPVRPLPGRPFMDRERPATDRERPFNSRERPVNEQGWPPRRGPPPRGEIPAPPR